VLNLKPERRFLPWNVVCLCAELPITPEIGQVRGQLQRSATSVAANYRSACRGKSKTDFIAKLGTVEERLTNQPSGWNSSRPAVRLNLRFEEASIG
jgi:hypothetical protein